MLSDNDCWELFKQRAFGPNEVEQVELMVIGKEIVKKCGGVPLAAKALGGLLRFKREIKEWLYVRESNLWSLPQNENSVMSALRLSYLNLPIKLRQCFAYCAIFPKDEIIRKRYLIELWMANGFISSNEILDAEDVGDGAWNELYWRSFFQDTSTDKFGKVITFKMHDLVHDLAQFVAEEVCCITNKDKLTTLSERIHHLSNCRWMENSSKEDNSMQLHQVKSLRTYVHNCGVAGQLSPSKLNSLRNLSMYIVGKKIGFLLAELGQLELKGDLHIKHLENVKSVMDVKEANMSSKQLNRLLLSWEGNDESELQENVEQILEVLEPRTEHLQLLSVGGYKGAHFPQWMSSASLKYLAHLDLVDCKNCLQLPLLGKLPSLVSLSISYMTRVMYLHEESYDGGVVFMALEFLLLEELPNLIRLSREDGENMFPRLSTLQITDCSKLLALPSLPSIKELRIQGKCNQDLPSSIHRLSSLEYLQFMYNEPLTCFPDGMLQNLTSLKTLDLYKLSRLEVLPAEIINLAAIQELCINDCDSLKSLADEVLLQGLHSLKKLKIVGCPKFNVSAVFQYLTCLEDLKIGKNTQVEGLHEALQHMTALRCLELWDLQNLESLSHCFGNLGSLKSLNISGCPELGKRCQKETGEDWPKIAHKTEEYSRAANQVMDIMIPIQNSTDFEI
ncbi:putative disease resistance protein RGA4, partial [Mucuna pruriens]